MKTLIKGCVAACAMVAVSAAAQSVTSAQSDQQAEQANERRQALMVLHSWTMAPIGGMLQGNIDFDASLAQHQAERMEQLAQMIPDVFAVDTREYDLETEAMDAVWEDWDGFVERAGALASAARNAADTAANGNQQATMQALGGIGQSCGGCHDNYRD